MQERFGVGHAHVLCFIMNYDQLTRMDQLEFALPCRSVGDLVVRGVAYSTCLGTLPCE